MTILSDDFLINYAWIKQAAKQYNVSVNDLIALAPQNDPFYTGTPNDHALANWFADIWRRVGDERAHIRRIHYWIVSQGGGVTMPNGKPYENTVESWDMLNLASKCARYLELVDPAAFNDRRTPETMIFAGDRNSYNPWVSVNGSLPRSGIELPPFPDLPDYTVYGYHGVQPYHLEVWCEKSTMNDVLAPLCKRYGANLQTGMGEMSITATLSLVKRLQAADKPARIFYVSDFDPAGQSMPVAVSRKIEYFVRQSGLDLDIRLFPVVLTLDQVQYYQLPRTPIKETERRREGFEERHGEGAVELDALEALYPGELGTLLSQYIEQYYDTTLVDRVREERQVLEQELGQIWQGVIERYEPSVSQLQQEYADIKADIDTRLSQFSQHLMSIWQAMKGELEGYNGLVDDYPIPAPYSGGEISEGLYNSLRGYVEQIRSYKQFQGRS